MYERKRLCCPCPIGIIWAMLTTSTHFLPVKTITNLARPLDTCRSHDTSHPAAAVDPSRTTARCCDTPPDQLGRCWLPLLAAAQQLPGPASPPSRQAWPCRLPASASECPSRPGTARKSPSPPAVCPSARCCQCAGCACSKQHKSSVDISNKHTSAAATQGRITF